MAQFTSRLASAGARKLEPPKYKCEAPIMGVWGKSPSGVQGQSPWSGDRRLRPLNLKHFWLLDVHRKSLICPF